MMLKLSKTVKLSSEDYKLLLLLLLCGEEDSTSTIHQGIVYPTELMNIHMVHYLYSWQYEA